MNGAGNDFILIDNRAGQLRLTLKQVVRLCHRQRGIGADGLILLVPCATGRAQWAWQFFNSDGSLADMCGNGARCFARFVQRLTGAAGELSIETGAGVVRASLEGELVTVNLTDPKDLRLDEVLTAGGGPLSVHSLHTGVPHAVLFVPDLEGVAVHTLGAELRYHPRFAPRGTNVNFVHVLGPGSVRVRTYERGVEAETLACGTGVTASALISAVREGFPSPVSVRVQGGETLEVGFRLEGEAFRDVWLKGPADFVFEGRCEL